MADKGKRKGKEKPIQIVTSSKIEGHKIVETKGLVWANSVRAKFLLEDLKALFKIFAGGEIKEYSNLINEGRWDVFRKLNSNAKVLGANAIIDLRFISNQVISGTVEISAYGTAVVIEKEK